MHNEVVAPVFVHEPPLKHGLAAHGSATTGVAHNTPPKFLIDDIQFLSIHYNFLNI